jgi:hypothetical protein
MVCAVPCRSPALVMISPQCGVSWQRNPHFTDHCATSRIPDFAVWAFPISRFFHQVCSALSSINGDVSFHSDDKKCLQTGAVCCFESRFQLCHTRWAWFCSTPAPRTVALKETQIVKQHRGSRLKHRLGQCSLQRGNLWWSDRTQRRCVKFPCTSLFVEEFHC